MSKKLTLLVTSLLTAGILSAQKKDTLQGNPLDPVIVTANKAEQKQSATGKVVTVISKEQIEKSAGKTVAQLLNEQAGISVNGAYNTAGSVQTLFIRGAASGRALVLVDGIPVNDPSMINNEFDLNLFSLNDVERIEICKGAQSTLYGSDAVAGVVNIITVKPDIKNPVNVKASLSGGNLGTFKGNLQFYGKAGKLTYTARYSKLRTDGFSSAYDKTGTGNFDKDGYDGNTANTSLQYQATQQLMFKVFAQYSQYKAGVDASGFTDRRNYDINNRDFSTGTGFRYKNQTLTLTGNYEYSVLNRNYNDNASVPGAASWSLNNYNGIAQFAELFTNIKLRSGFSLLAGGDFRYSSMNNQYASLSSYSPTPYKSNFPDSAVNQSSVYSSLNFNSDHFNLEVGARMNSHSRYGTNYTYTFNPSYTIDEHYRVFGSIASGFKAPTLYQLYAPSHTGNPNLRPERSVNYEIGIDQHFKTFGHRLVFFYRDITDGTDFNNNSYQYFNFASQSARGIEYEIHVQPAEHFSISANYTYLSISESTESRINFKDTTYSYALRRPKHNFNITAAYQFTPALYVSLSGKYVSERYDAGAYASPDVLLGDYFLLGAHAEYKFSGHFRLFTDMQNITNRKFFEVNGYNSIPFMINAGVTLNW